MKISKLLFLCLALSSLASCSATKKTSNNNSIQNQADSKNSSEEINNKDDNKQNNDGKQDDGKKDDKKEEYTYQYYDDSDSFTAGAVKLSFNSAGNYEYLKGIDGQKVALKGFMFTASPVDGSFMFLSNMPYQTCPFCALNTSELSNCYEIYPKKNSKYNFIESAICVVGTLKVAPSRDEPFTDRFDYNFLSKIENGEIKILDNIEDEGDFTLRNAFAKTTLLNDIYDMLNYVNFVCTWPEYYINTYEDKYGEFHNGHYLYPYEAYYYITEDGAQFNYGYVDGYFESFVTRIKSISETGFNDLIEIIEDCKSVAKHALNELESDNFTAVKQYVEMFNAEDYVYTMNDTTLKDMPNELYNRFSYWLTSFEM